MPKETKEEIVTLKMDKAEALELANTLLPLYEEYKKIETLLIQGGIIEKFLEEVDKQTKK